MSGVYSRRTLMPLCVVALTLVMSENAGSQNSNPAQIIPAPPESIPDSWKEDRYRHLKLALTVGEKCPPLVNPDRPDLHLRDINEMNAVAGRLAERMTAEEVATINQEVAREYASFAEPCGSQAALAAIAGHAVLFHIRFGSSR